MTEMASNPQEISKEDLKTDVCPTSKVTDLMSHDELVQFFQESLKMLVKMDPLLKDVRPDITLDEVCHFKCFHLVTFKSNNIYTF